MLSLLFVSFTAPVSAGGVIQAQLPISASVSCAVRDRNSETDYDFVCRPWRETDGHLDCEALSSTAQMVTNQYHLSITAQVVTDQYQVHKIVDGGSIGLQFPSAVEMASDECHDEQDQLQDICRQGRHELKENGFQLSNLLNSFAIPSTIMGANGPNAVLKTKGNLHDGASSNPEMGGNVDFFIDKKHLKELLEHKRKWKKTPIFAVVICKEDVAAHGYRNHRYEQKQETTLESYFFFFTGVTAAILVAFLVSRPKLKVDLQLDFGDVSDQRMNTDGDRDQTVTVDAVVINDEEPQAVIVY